MLRKTSIMMIIFASTLLFGCESEVKENKEITLDTNTEVVQNEGPEKAADFTLKTIDGEEVSLSDYEGKVVLLDFWATWCPPCRRGVPDLVEIQNQYKDEVVVIGISLDNQSTVADIEPFMEEYGINYPVVLGNQQVVTDYGNIQAIPTSFIIDQSGNIQQTHVGLVPKSTLVADIEDLL